MNIIGTSIMTKNIFKEILLISLNTFYKNKWILFYILYNYWQFYNIWIIIFMNRHIIYELLIINSHWIYEDIK